MLNNRALRVKALDNYLIVVHFASGEDKVYNCYPLLSDKLFAELADEQFFKTVHIDEMGLVCWNDATDIEPNELYNNSVSVANLAI
jgi:hypothetical protein